MENLLSIVLATIVIATLLNVLLRRFEIPTVIGYIAAGLIITEIFGLHGEKDNEALHQLAEFGIVFLMFTIGLEFSVRHLKAMKKEVFLFGGLQMLVTGSIFCAFLYTVLDIGPKSSIIIGFSLALSSTAIVLKMLTERNEVHSGYGRISVGILLFQDIAVIPILLMLTLFAAPERSITDMLLWTFADALILIGAVYLAGRFLLEPFLAWTLSSDSEEIFLVAALMIVIGFSFLAHYLGFSYSLGAFLAGMTLSETRFKYRIEADLLSFRDIFLGIFFVTIGMQIDPAAIAANWVKIALFLAGVLSAKALLLFLVLLFFMQKRTALKSALALMQVGEFALAVFAIAALNGLIDPGQEQVLIVTIALSMVITPFVIKNLKKIADIFTDGKSGEAPNISSAGYRGHILLVGYGMLGKSLAEELKRISVPYLIIEHDYRLVQEAREKGEPVVMANAAAHSVLKAVGVREALAVVIVIENAAKTRMVVDAVSSIAPKTNTVVAVRNRSQQQIIETFGVNHIVNASDLLSEAILKEILRCKVEEPGGNESSESSRDQWRFMEI